jgi:hypothetical protein
VYVANERLDDRVKYSNGTFQEPWYATFKTPYDRWVNLDDEMVLASSVEAYLTYRQTALGKALWKFYGSFLGTKTVVGSFETSNNVYITYTVFFNQATMPMNYEDTPMGFDGNLEVLMKSLPMEAWGGVSTTCPGLNIWNTNAVYTMGTQVQLNGVKYLANWWVQGQNPEQFSGPWQVWTNLGECL